MSLYDFRLSVIESLFGPNPKDPPAKKLLVEHLPQNCPKGPNGKTKRRRCKYCWDTTKIRKDTIYFCPHYPQKPDLCLENRFRLFYEQNYIRFRCSFLCKNLGLIYILSISSFI